MDNFALGGGDYQRLDGHQLGALWSYVAATQTTSYGLVAKQGISCRKSDETGFWIEFAHRMALAFSSAATAHAIGSSDCASSECCMGSVVEPE